MSSVRFDEDSAGHVRRTLNLLRLAVFLAALGRALRAVDDNLAPLD